VVVYLSGRRTHLEHKKYEGPPTIARELKAWDSTPQRNLSSHPMTTGIKSEASEGLRVKRATFVSSETPAFRLVDRYAISSYWLTVC
jgi:hypothetical protein